MKKTIVIFGVAIFATALFLNSNLKTNNNLTINDLMQIDQAMAQDDHGEKDKPKEPKGTESQRNGSGCTVIKIRENGTTYSVSGIWVNCAGGDTTCEQGCGIAE